MPNLEYIRSVGKKKYLSIEKHQPTASNTHAKWESIAIERDLFDFADFGNFDKIDDPVKYIEWQCPESLNMWSIGKSKESVGKNKEQFGFFQKPVNVNEPWHGFPIVPFSKSRYKISERLFNLWVHHDIIAKDDIPSILKKKRI